MILEEERVNMVFEFVLVMIALFCLVLSFLAGMIIEIYPEFFNEILK